jgi:signal transduction histidine kinase
MASSAVAAPADVMRVLAHDLRQPLSTIESIAYYLTLILPEDEKVREQLDRIQQLVEQSNWMLTSGQFLSDPLPAATEIVDLCDLISHIDLAGFDLELPPARTLVQADASLLRAMIENLAMLFRQFSTRPLLRVAERVVEISTPATGHRSKSSLGPGSALSLQGARRVAESIGGSLDVSIHPERGIAVRVVLSARC